MQEEVKNTSLSAWDTLDLNEATLSVIKDKLGFDTMTPVQKACIPLFMQHKDVMVQAVTGSGKTLAFLVPCLEILHRRTEKLKKFDVGAIVMSPTRELATQIKGVCELFMDHFPELTLYSVIGGTNTEEDSNIWSEHGGNIVIATPGRLEDTMNRYKSFNVKTLEVLILDEADRLMSLGFDRTVMSILRKLPKQRRTGLFSATQSAEVAELGKAGLRNPVGIHIKVHGKSSSTNSSREQAVPNTLENYYQLVQYEDKIALLVDFLLEMKNSKCIVFFLTCAAVDYWTRVLSQIKCIQENNIPIMGLHGKMKNVKRIDRLKKFTELNGNGVLLCTDVAARGIDIADVEWIIQYEAPQDPDYFVHRVGRTARAGRKGKAVVFLDPVEEAYVDFLRASKVHMSNLDLKIKEIEPPILMEEIKSLAVNDRDIMEKGQHAVVSFFRAYKEHRCNFIFVFNKLPFGQVAAGYGLLYMPRMSELMKFKFEFISSEVKASDIKYKDPKREKQRIAHLQAQKLKGEKEKKKREERKFAREKHLAEKPKRKKSRARQVEDDWEELRQETLLYKKLRKGKITKEQYEEETAKL